MQSVMKIVCCFCNEVKGVKDGHGVSGETSTICPRCVDKHFPELAEEWHRRHDALLLEVA